MKFFIDIDQTISTGYTGLPPHSPLPGARSGVQSLKHYGEIIYVAVRSPYLEDVTRAWLDDHLFPAGELIFCQSTLQKLLAIAECEGQIFLVDDCWLDVLDHLKIDLHCLSLLSRLVVVAFGVDRVPSSVVPVVPLPDWSRMGELLLCIC